MSDGFWDSFKNRRIEDFHAALNDAYRSIEQWMAHSKRLEARNSELEAKVAQLEKERDGLKRQHTGDLRVSARLSLSTIGSRSELIQAYKALDEAYGRDGNPLRKPVPDDQAIEHPLKGRKDAPTCIGDLHYYEGLAAMIRRLEKSEGYAPLKEGAPDFDFVSLVDDSWRAQRDAAPSDPEPEAGPPTP